MIVSGSNHREFVDHSVLSSEIRVNEREIMRDREGR